MESSKIVSLEEVIRKENRYPSEEEAIDWAIRLCELVEDKNGNYPLVGPKNIYIENDENWTLAQSPATNDASEALFRIGAVLHYLLTRKPFQISHYLDGPPAIGERNPQISVRLESIITRLLQNKRALRYSSIPELRAELERLQKELAGDWKVWWPCFKGNGARTSRLSDQDFDPRGKTLKEVWKAPVGEIWASPVMAGENVYVGSGNGNFYCVDAQTGKVIWKLLLNSRIESTACINESIAYLGNDFGVLHAINIKTGAILWKKSLGEYVRSSPYCSGNRIYVGSIGAANRTGTFWALDKERGSVVWKRTMGPVFSSPVIDHKQVIIGSDDKNLYCFETSGRLKWKLNLGGKIRSTAAVVRGFVYAGGFGRVLHKVRRASGKTVWKGTTGSMYSSPAYGRSFIVTGNNSGRILIFHITSGKKKAEFTCGGPITSSPLVINQFTLIGSNEGVFYVLDSAAKVVCSFDAKSPINSSACYHDNMIYLGSDKGLHALSL